MKILEGVWYRFAKITGEKHNGERIIRRYVNLNFVHSKLTAHFKM